MPLSREKRQREMVYAADDYWSPVPADHPAMNPPSTFRSDMLAPPNRSRQRSSTFALMTRSLPSGRH
jgi:hypothetical protein